MSNLADNWNISSLVLYDKGFTVNGSELRDNSKLCNQSFIKDIFDGFFPQEFKEAHPGGVTFKVECNKSKEFKFPKSNI